MNKYLKFINYLLIGFVIGMLVYVVGIGPSAFEAKIESVNKVSEDKLIIVENLDIENVNINGLEDERSGDLELTPVEKCESEFNKYSEIGENTYEQVDFSLILTKEINSDEEAKEFDDTYSNFISGKLLGMDLSTFKEIEYDYPIIALLAKINVNQESEESSPISMILFCSGDGVISEQSKKTLTFDN